MTQSPRLVRALGWCALFLGAAATPFILFAWLEGAASEAQGFLATALGGVFAGGVTLAGTAGTARPATASASLRLSLLVWLAAPLLAAPPLIAAAGDIMTGVFEAYSALTTTGAVLLAPEDVSRAGVLWRCLLAWFGGLGSLVLAVTVFAALEDTGTGLRRTSLLTIERADLFTNFGPALRRLGAAYLVVTGAGFLLLSASGASAFDALCLSLAGLSTAGLAPQSGPLAQWLDPGAIFVLALLCIMGAWNFAAFYEMLVRHRARSASGELRAMAMITLAVALAAALAGGAGALLPAGLDTIFAITTSGYQTVQHMTLPVPVLIFLALIGGSAVSTSGGLKMTRVLILMRRAWGEVTLLAHPSAAVRSRYGGRTLTDDAFASVAVYALAYPVALGVGAILLSATGIGFEDAWRAAGAAIANAGPLAGPAFDDLNPVGLTISIALMVLGRLEILAAFAALGVMFAGD
jgi:trk system potassium uptake protein